MIYITSATGALAEFNFGLFYLNSGEILKTRLISSAVGIAIVILTVMFNQRLPMLINVFFALASLLMVIELLGAKRLISNLPVAIPCMIFASICPILISGKYFDVALVAFTILLFSMMMFFHKKITFNDIAFAFSVTLLISLSLSTVPLLCSEYNKHASFFMILALGVPWFTDTGGLFAGLAFGKHKLCPNISPKKTVEGFVGGIVLGVASSLVIGLVFEFWIYSDVTINYLFLLLLGILNSFLAVLGDLSFSIIKRTFHVKDYGNAIPGHGGIADRFDSIVFTAPVLLLLTEYISYLL